MSEPPVVLVVEDESDVAETYELWLDAEYDVRLAADGQVALETLAHEDVDVVLLDRMMPGMSGEEVLAELRERGHDCRVAMVTAVDPDFDIVEMGFDDYVTKPPKRDELRETVEELLDRADHTDRVREYHAMLSKRATLESEKTAAELADSDEFEELEARIEETEAALDDDADRLLDDTAFVGELRELAGEAGERPDRRTPGEEER